MNQIQNFLIDDIKVFTDLVHNEKLTKKTLKLIETNDVKISISIDLQMHIETISQKQEKEKLRSKKDMLKIQTEHQGSLILSQENSPFILIGKDSSLPFEATKINLKEFIQYVDVISQMNLFLLSEFNAVELSFLSLVSIQKLDLNIINQYPYFFQIVINSLQTNLYTKLRRIFYKFNSSYDICSFIEKSSLNIHIFSIEMLMKRKNFKDNDLIKSYPKNCQTLSIKLLKKYFEKSNLEINKYLEIFGQELLFYIKRITYQIKDKYENKFGSIGHKVFAHLDRDITGNEKKLFDSVKEQDIYDIVTGLNYLKFLITQLYTNGTLMGYFLDIEKTDQDFDQAVTLWKEKWQIDRNHSAQSNCYRYERFSLLEVKDHWYFYGRNSDGSIIKGLANKVIPDIFNELEKKNSEIFETFESKNELLDLILSKLGYSTNVYDTYSFNCEQEVNQEIRELFSSAEIT